MLPTTHHVTSIWRRLPLLALALAAGLSAALFLGALAAVAAPAAPAAQERSYPGTDPCDTTLQACIDGADDGDTIVIQAGEYFTGVTLHKPVSLTGVASNTVILSALLDQRVLTVTGPAISGSVVISGMTITGGNTPDAAFCPDNCGGGILLFDSASPLLTGLIISGNAARDGGGVYAFNGSALRLSHSQVISNKVQSDGGGVHVHDDDLAQAWHDAHDVLFQGNYAANRGGGLAVYGRLALSDAQLIGNSAGSSGGGVWTSNHSLVSNALFHGNDCFNSACSAGGMRAGGRITATGLVFISNTAGFQAGGLQIGGTSHVTGGLFQGNRCLHVDCSGGALVSTIRLTMTGTQFISNTARRSAGALWAEREITLTSVLLQGNACTQDECRGGAMRSLGQLAISGTRFIANSGGLGGGLYVSDENNAAIANSLFAANNAVSGTALYMVSDGALRMAHNTIAAPAQVVSAAVQVAAGSASFTNTLFSNHNTGILLTGGSAEENYSLFSSVPTATSGGVTGGTGSLAGDAGFADAAGGDYRLTAGSDAIDAGVNAGLAHDFEGDPRPLGPGFDIGFDEFVPEGYWLYLPLVMR